MAIAKATADKLKKLGIDVNKLTEAAKAETDVEVDVPDGDVYTATEIDTLKRERYEEGKKVGAEVLVKDYKKANNLEFKGTKLEDLHKALTEGKEEADVVAKLRQSLEAAETAKSSIESQFNSFRMESKITELIPSLNNGMKPSEAIAILKANGMEFKEEKGALYVFKDGEQVRDAKQLPVQPKDAITNFFTERKWVGDVAPERKGRGEGNYTGAPNAKATKLSDFNKQWEAQHGTASKNGLEYSDALSAHISEMNKAGQTFDTNS